MKLKFVLIFFSLASALSMGIKQVVTARRTIVEAPSAQLNEMAAGQKGHLKHQFGEVRYEQKITELAALLRAGKYSEIESQINQFHQEKLSTKGGFYYADAVLRSIITDNMLNEEIFRHLVEWNEASTDSIVPLLMRADFYLKLGWNARGGGWWHEVPESDRETYRQFLQMGLQDLAAAKELDPLNPLVLVTILTVAKEIDLPRDIVEEYFTELITQIPGMPQAYQSKMQYLLWQGTNQEVLNFIRKATAEAPRGSAVPIIVSQAHRTLASRQKDQNFRKPAVWADIESSLPRLVEDFPEVGLYAAWYAELAYYGHKDDIAQEYIQIALEREPNHPDILGIYAKMK